MELSALRELSASRELPESLLELPESLRLRGLRQKYGHN
jgi:hypothetical protein